MDYKKAAIELHEKYKGKIEIKSKVALKTREDLSTSYTPGVAEPCLKIHENEIDVYKYTSKGNLVAVVSDGSAVLGLGNIGPKAAIPVMEGKAILFKQFGGVDAFPICLDTQDTEEIIKAVKWIAPCFGGINLEDICAPKCFEIEQRLEKDLDIPVFHDDQHGTAIVTLAALTNALKLIDIKIEKIKIVVSGCGSAATAIVKMLLIAGVQDIVICDSNGVIYKDREGINGYKRELSGITNPRNVKGSLADAVKNSDVFVGVSVANILTKDMVRSMAKDPIVFAMANPDPEISYEDAIAAGVKIMGTGRSDYPNQINNVLAFPGVFRGALDAKSRDITPEMKLAAAKAIAELVSDEELSPEYIIPSPFDERVSKNVALRVVAAAKK